MYDVITVGSATFDVFAKTEAELINIKHGKEEEKLIAYPSGTKILITNLDFHTGGGGTNTSVAFSRLGLKTAFLGKLGNDNNAELIMKQLNKEKIDFIGVKGKVQTGYSVVLDSIEEDRTILTYKGANSNLKFSEIKKSQLKTKWLYFSSMMGESYSTLEKLAEFAKKKKIMVAFNPSSYLAKEGTVFLRKLLKNVDLLILNREEAEYLVGHNPLIELLKNLSILGPKYTIITDGKNGANAYDGEFHYFIKSNKVRVKETTGAGDSFASGVVAGLIYENDLKFGLNLGMVNATSVIKHMGAKNKLLKYNEALKLMKKNKKIIVKKVRK